VGHLRYWDNKIAQLGIGVAGGVSDQLVKSRMWLRNFQVLDFKVTRNDALETWGSFTCYSDGSKQGNHTGYGYIIKRYNQTMYEGMDYMGPRASVFLAEVRAITTIAKVLMHQCNTKILIRSDSQAAISAISSTNIGSKTVAECRNTLNRLGTRNNVTIAWVKAHAQHVGNEQADQLAKLGARQVIGPARFQYYECSTSFSNSILDKINLLWQQRWDQQPEMYTHSKVFITSIQATKNKFNIILKNENRVTVGKFAQFITGHGYLNYHLNKSNPFIEQNCRKCLQGPETPVHLIESCEAYTNHRRDAFDGQDVLTPGFGWNIAQIQGFLMESDLWTVMDHLQ
jgi:ribonuclease HI